MNESDIQYILWCAQSYDSPEYVMAAAEDLGIWLTYDDAYALWSGNFDLEDYAMEDADMTGCGKTKNPATEALAEQTKSENFQKWIDHEAKNKVCPGCKSALNLQSVGHSQDFLKYEATYRCNACNKGWSYVYYPNTAEEELHQN